MRDIINKVKIALDKPLERISISVKKNDSNTRKIHFTLTQEGVVYNLDNVKIAAIIGIKPDNKHFYNDCVIKDNEIQYTITGQSICVEGDVKCELVLFGSNDEEIASATFYIHVYEKLFDEDVVESTNEYKLLKAIIEESDANLKKTIEYAEQVEKLAKSMVIDKEELDEAITEAFNNIS